MRLARLAGGRLGASKHLQLMSPYSPYCTRYVRNVARIRPLQIERFWMLWGRPMLVFWPVGKKVMDTGAKTG